MKPRTSKRTVLEGKRSKFTVNESWELNKLVRPILHEVELKMFHVCHERPARKFINKLPDGITDPKKRTVVWTAQVLLGLTKYLGDEHMNLVILPESK